MADTTYEFLVDDGIYIRLSKAYQIQVWNYAVIYTQWFIHHIEKLESEAFATQEYGHLDVM